MASAWCAWVCLSVTLNPYSCSPCYSIDGQWICQKSHLQRARRERKAQRESEPTQPGSLSSHLSISRKSKHRKDTTHNGTNGAQKEKSQSKRQDSDEELPSGSIAWMDGTRCMLYAHGGVLFPLN